MVKLVLIRHGESELNSRSVFYGHLDPGLSENGRLQAELLSKNYHYDKPDLLVCSDMKRALETAAPLAQRFGLKINAEQDLKEMDFGLWEGLEYCEINSRWPDELKCFYSDPYEAHIPGGESMKQVESRCIKRIKELVLEHQNKNETIAIVAHGIVIKLIIAYCLQMPMKNIWSIQQYNTAVNVLRFDEGNCTVELLNCISHINLKK